MARITTKVAAHYERMLASVDDKVDTEGVDVAKVRHKEVLIMHKNLRQVKLQKTKHPRHW